MRKALVNPVLFVLLIVFLLGPFSMASAKELKIGVSLCMSGAAAATGLGLMRGLELAADEINTTGGVRVQKDSYQIKLIMYDNKYDTKEGVAIANKLIYRDGVKYIVTMGAGLIIATNDLIVENKILQLIYAYGGKKTTNPRAPFTFKILMEPINSYTIFLPWIAKNYNLKTIALTSNDDETGLIQTEDAEFVAKKLGLQITDKVFALGGRVISPHVDEADREEARGHRLWPMGRLRRSPSL
jgi:branched-chain amino acid transport system substrate-binding protein